MVKASDSKIIAAASQQASTFQGQEQGQPFPWQRILQTTAFLGLGATVLAVGAGSIGYRLTHHVVDNGIINARTVRLRSPIDGNIRDFYARPGVAVEAGQVLAKVDRSASEEQALVQLKGQEQAKNSQLESARQSREFLKQQLQQIEGQYASLTVVESSLSTSEVEQHQAALDRAIAQAEAARLEHDRYSQLLSEGAISRQRVDQLKATLEAAEADVRQERAALNAAQSALNASRNQSAIHHYQAMGNRFAQDRAQLSQQVQQQSTLISTLEVELQGIRQQISQMQSQYSGDRSLNVEAPFAGIVYRTDREQSEQVQQSEPVLTLLDCNDLWVETVVSAEQVSNFNLKHPVSVEFANQSQSVTGVVELVQPISGVQAIGSASDATQVQALTASIPPQLVGRPLTRITIRIPSPPGYTQAMQFCGVGQAARLTFKKQMFGR